MGFSSVLMWLELERVCYGSMLRQFLSVTPVVGRQFMSFSIWVPAPQNTMFFSSDIYSQSCVLQMKQLWLIWKTFLCTLNV